MKEYSSSMRWYLWGRLINCLLTCAVRMHCEKEKSAWNYWSSAAGYWSICLALECYQEYLGFAGSNFGRSNRFNALRVRVTYLRYYPATRSIKKLARISTAHWATVCISMGTNKARLWNKKCRKLWMWSDQCTTAMTGRSTWKQKRSDGWIKALW
jgi:hypothetical protein